MEQYWNLMWKNYTSSLSRNSASDDFSSDTNDPADAFVNNDLHYKIPFWIGVIVISLLFLSAIIASIRYCLHMLYAAHRETEKVSLVPPKSPFIPQNAVHTLQRQTRPMAHVLVNSSNREEKCFSSSSPSSSSSHEESREKHASHISIVPIVHAPSRPGCTSKSTLAQRHQIDTDPEDSYFPPMHTPHSRISNDFRKKVHGIYVLPVSPALSSSSSSATTNTDDMIKAGSSTMPIRSKRHIASNLNVNHESTSQGIKNDCFTDSPQPKDRTLPRSHAGTLRRLHQAPTQPPPLPPLTSHPSANTLRSFIERQTDQISFEHQHRQIDLDPDAIALRFSSQTIYGAHRDHQTPKVPPPPVPNRSQKPSVMPIGFEGLTATHSDRIGFRAMIESLPQDEYSEHAWPNPPESMITSDMTNPSPNPQSSISYDRLHHDHAISHISVRQNSTTSFFHHHRQQQQHFPSHSMFSESET